MSAVDTCVHGVDSRLWHNLESFANKSLHGARACATPVAVAIFIRDVALLPAKCVEEAYLTAKAIQVYRKETRQNYLAGCRNDIQIHALHTLAYGVIAPFSPLVGIVHAVIALVKITLSPLKTAKINAAEQELKELLEFKNWRPFKIYSNGELLHFADEVAFAEDAFRRFKEEVSVGKEQDIGPLYFYNGGETIKNALLREVETKERVFHAAQRVYHSMFLKCYATNSDITQARAQESALNKQWKEFQNCLIQATYKEAKQMVFTPAG